MICLMYGSDNMKIKCLWCDDIIDSKELHHMKWCKCGKTALDYHPIWWRVVYNSKEGSNMYEVIDYEGVE